MPTCKNCLHVELCKEDLLNSMKGLGLSNEQEIIEIGLNSQNNDCEFFKDSSKFVELPELEEYTTVKTLDEAIDHWLGELKRRIEAEQAIKERNYV